MQFKIEGGVNTDGSWSLIAVVPNGETVMSEHVEEVLFRAMCHYRAQRGTRMPTVAEVAAAVVTLPDGWAPSLDGVNTTICEGVTSHSRRYTKTVDEIEVESREARCAADGSATHETVTDLSNPSPA